MTHAERRREAELQRTLAGVDRLAAAFPRGAEDRDVLERAGRVIRFELEVLRRAAR